MVDLWTVFRSQNLLATLYYITIMVSNYNLRIRIFTSMRFTFNTTYDTRSKSLCIVMYFIRILNLLIKIGKQIQKKFVSKEKNLNGICECLIWNVKIEQQLIAENVFFVSNSRHCLLNS